MPSTHVPYLLLGHVVEDVDSGAAGHSEAGLVGDGGVEVGAGVGGGVCRLGVV